MKTPIKIHQVLGIFYSFLIWMSKTRTWKEIILESRHKKDANVIIKISCQRKLKILDQFLWNLLSRLILNFFWFFFELFLAPSLSVNFTKRFRILRFWTFWTTVTCAYNCFLRCAIASSWLYWNGRAGSLPPRLIWNFQSNFDSTKRTIKRILIKNILLSKIRNMVAVELIWWRISTYHQFYTPPRSR